MLVRYAGGVVTWSLGSDREARIGDWNSQESSVQTALFTLAKTRKQPKCPFTETGFKNIYIYIYQIRSVAQSCPTLCDPMNRSTPGLPVPHQLPEFT